MSKHTKEPWFLRLSDNGTPHIEHGAECFLDDVGCSENKITTLPAEITQSYNSYENAKRIVLCVNACAGMENKDLEGLPIKNHINAITERLISCRRGYSHAGVVNSALEKSISTITKQRDDLLASLKQLLSSKAEPWLFAGVAAADNAAKLIKSIEDGEWAATGYYPEAHKMAGEL